MNVAISRTKEIIEYEILFIIYADFIANNIFTQIIYSTWIVRCVKQYVY